MKRIMTLALALLLAISLAACGNGATTEANQAPAEVSPTPTQGNMSGGSGENDEPKEPQDPPKDDDNTGDAQRSTPYHDSIWVLEGSGSTMIELAEGYTATYSADLSLVKLDGGSAQGTYQGGLYAAVDLSAGEYIKELLKNMPGANINFDLSGYALDNLAQLSLWNYYQYDGADWEKSPVDASGKEVPIAKDSYWGKGELAMNIETSGEASGGFDFSGQSGSIAAPADLMNKAVGGDLGYHIYCPPNPEETGDQSGGVRRAIITLTFRGETNVELVIEGTLTRMPGGLENQDKFTKGRKPFSEKYGKDDTTLSKNLRP